MKVLDPEGVRRTELEAAVKGGFSDLAPLAKTPDKRLGFELQDLLAVVFSFDLAVSRSVSFANVQKLDIRLGPPNAAGGGTFQLWLEESKTDDWFVSQLSDRLAAPFAALVMLFRRMSEQCYIFVNRDGVSFRKSGMTPMTDRVMLRLIGKRIAHSKMRARQHKEATDAEKATTTALSGRRNFASSHTTILCRARGHSRRTADDHYLYEHQEDMTAECIDALDILAGRRAKACSALGLTKPPPFSENSTTRSRTKTTRLQARTATQRAQRVKRELAITKVTIGSDFCVRPDSAAAGNKCRFDFWLARVTQAPVFEQAQAMVRVQWFEASRDFGKYTLTNCADVIPLASLQLSVSISANCYLSGSSRDAIQYYVNQWKQVPL
jgi:hypothetical protein